ncbi:hypothetical protein DAPPUDRAFT_327643 [Daphnia pulex]|uniref:Uncharacterized protein n=1 Tax=Daphnia pulex TaxID=6669 RepID=E9HBB6_DAPPU|nr:hypothetical protein DAPPUDRAFT_327643 [Daphnia pulex]|eukprot:EFX70977.1 hypothetical protein DAPPUDRAFT_327643 [Daphnia pulex]
MEGIVDCLATRMKYHINCSVEHGKGIKRKSVGHPVNEELLLVFNKTLQFYEETEKELFTISEMCKTMTWGIILKSLHEAKTNGALWKWNHNYYRSKPGRLNIFSSSIRHIVETLYSQYLTNFEEKKIGIQKTAAKILLNDIGKIERNKDHYDIFGKLSLAVQLHHLYSSKNIINILHQHGFCASYDEVLMFERCAAITTNTELNIQPNSVGQYVADNADHNLRTIDG